MDEKFFSGICAKCNNRVKFFNYKPGCPLCGSVCGYTKNVRISLQMHCPGCNRLFTRVEGEDKCYDCGIDLPFYKFKKEEQKLWEERLAASNPRKRNF